MTLSKHFDTHGRIKEVQYEIFRSLMYWMTVQYDSMGRVVKRELKIGPYANTTQYRYDYDGDGQLSGVKVNTILIISDRHQCDLCAKAKKKKKLIYLTRDIYMFTAAKKLKN